MNGMDAIASAIGSMSEVNIESQNTTVLEVLFVINCNFPLQEAYSDTLSKDQRQYYVDSLRIIRDPSYTAVASADYAQYSLDSSEMENETGAQTTLLQTEKGMVQSKGNDTSTIFAMEKPVVGLQKEVSNLISGYMR